jgi:hypothetical protein
VSASGSAILLAALSATSAATAATPLSEEQQLHVLDDIGTALAGPGDGESVARHFHEDAVFAGAENYPWSLAGFRKLLLSRDCSTDPSRSISGEHALIGYSDSERAAAEAHPSYGPGLIFYCISPRRVAAHEIYMFRFRGAKISRVTFAREMRVPAPTPPPAKGSRGRG